MGMFKTYFNVISKENADDLTTPTVLELDTVPAESQSVETDAVNTDAVDSEYTSNAVQLVEASAEQDALVEESNIVDDTVEKVEEDLNTIGDRLEANDAAVAAGGDDQITPAEVAIATQSLELRLERLGLNLRDLSSSANISKETFISRENGGLGRKPSEVLKSLHYDMSREDGILSKIVEGGKAIWKAICDMARKIADFILNLFRSQKAIMENILKKLSPLQDATFKFDYYTVAPAYAVLKSIGPNIVHITANKEGVDELKNAINLSNELTKKINALPQAGEKEVKTAVAGLLANYYNNLIEVNISGIKSIPAGTYRIGLLRKNSATLFSPDFKNTLAKGGNFPPDSVKQYSVSYENLDKSDPVEFSRSQCKNVLNSAISTYDASNKYVKAIKDIINNMEKISVNGNKCEEWLANKVIRMYYKSIVTNAAKTLADGYDIVIAICKEALKDHKAAENKDNALLIENKA